MFTLEHFIWIAISIIIIVGMLILYKKLNLSFNTILNIMLVVSVLSEFIKIMCNMMPSPYKEGGMYLDPGDLPFHLCSIQIFLLFGMKFLVKSPSTKEKLLGFMAPTMMIGAIMALLIPTVGVEFTKIQVYQYFTFHSFLIFFAIYILKEKLVRWSLKTYFYNLAYIGGLGLIALWLNSFLSIAAPISGAFRRANFMYLTYPPMDGLPLLNLNNGWYAYFITLIALVIILVGVFHLIVTLIQNKGFKKRAEKQVSTEEQLSEN